MEGPLVGEQACNNRPETYSNYDGRIKAALCVGWVVVELDMSADDLAPRRRDMAHRRDVRARPAQCPSWEIVGR
jgi:hypothetical protein